VFGLLLAGDHSVGTPCTNVMNLSNIELAYNSKDTGFFPGGKQLAHDVDPSPPTSPWVKNEWNYVSTPCSVTSWSGQGQLTFLSLLLMV
jgi:hypothetical protein